MGKNVEWPETLTIYLAGKMSNGATWWRWNRVQVLVHDFRRRIAAKGKLPCQELVRHHCQCILIRSRHRLVVPLLRSHIVLGPADGLPRTRHCRHELGKTEISKQDIGTTWIGSVAPDEHIAGFDILVNDPTIMSMLEGICELTDDSGHIFRCEQHGSVRAALSPEPLVQGSRFQIGHHQVGQDSPLPLLLAKVKQGQDRGMIEERGPSSRAGTNAMLFWLNR